MVPLRMGGGLQLKVGENLRRKMGLPRDHRYRVWSHLSFFGMVVAVN